MQLHNEGGKIMKILLTGGLGFIGRMLKVKLQAKGHEVIALDLQVRDYDDYVRADVTEFLDLWRTAKTFDKFDYVVHMAGEVGRLVGEEHPHKMIRVNDIGTLNVIHICMEMGSNLVYFSTSEIYGRLLDIQEVTEESVNHLSPFMLSNVYAISKYFGEALVNHYVTNYNLKAVGIRPFMVYGPGVISSKYKSAIDQFIYNALTGKEFYVHRGSERAWCYIDDFIDGVMLVLEKHEFRDNVYEAYNIGTQEYKTMEEVGEIVLKYTKAPGELMKIVEPPEKFLVTRKRFSNKKLLNLGFEQKVPLKEGIKRTIEWHRSVVSGNNNW